MLKNILALIGLVTVVKLTVKAYNEHLREPLERRIADTLEDETRRQGGTVEAANDAQAGAAPAAATS